MEGHAVQGTQAKTSKPSPLVKPKSLYVVVRDPRTRQQKTFTVYGREFAQTLALLKRACAGEAID